MDGKDHSGRSLERDRARKQKNGVKNQRRIITFWQTHRRVLLSGFFLLAILALLIGIVAQFRAPAMTDVPSGETSIDYTVFLNQVNTGNVLAVTVRGNDVHALLQGPLVQDAGKQVVPLPADQQSAQLKAWEQYSSSPGNSSLAAAPTGFDPARVVYTLLPSEGASQLLPLLVSKHITVITQAPSQTPGWLSLLWKFAPLLFFMLLLAIVLAPRKQGHLPHNINEHIAHFTKKRLRRFEGTGSQSSRGNADKKPARPASTANKGHAAARSAFTPGGATSSPATSVAPSTTFADVAGIDEVRMELEEIVQFLRAPEKFDRLGAHIPRGALLVGPPGTGKTLLARAVAGEAGVPFFSISASEFVEMFVGVGASRVRELFQQARQAAPAVIFIDEIDAVGRKRAMKAMGNEERDQTLNQLLVEMDGFNARQAVVVMAATNRADILDKALLRPGRFDRHITVSLPDRTGRQAILKIHTAQTPLHEEVSLERLARLTTGMSGADLANLVNEAALCAARQDRETIDHACFEDALARVQLGALRPLVMTESDRRIIAYHEGGHALVAYHLPQADTVNRVTILPRGQSLGVTQFIAEEDRYNYSREMLMAKIAVGLGGRVAEELTLGRERVTTGAENDFQVVTRMARRMVTHWGMSDEVGVVFAGYDENGAGLNMSQVEPSLFTSHASTMALDAAGHLVPNGVPSPPVEYHFAQTMPAAGASSSPAMATLIDREVKKILDEGHAMARNILQQHFDQLQRLAEMLMEHEQLDRAAFETLVKM